MTEQAIVKAFQTALEQSQASFGMADALLIAGAIIVGFTVVLLIISYVAWKMFVGKPLKNVTDSNGKIVLQSKNVKKADEAHDLITQKDAHGVYIFLRIPEFMENIVRLCKEIRDGNRSIDSTLKNLYNHQSSRIDSLKQEVNELKK